MGGFLLGGCGLQLDSGVMSSVNRSGCGTAGLLWKQFILVLLFGVCMV